MALNAARYATLIAFLNSSRDAGAFVPLSHLRTPTIQEEGQPSIGAA
jgi:hypothetical protein